MPRDPSSPPSTMLRREFNQQADLWLPAMCELAGVAQGDSWSAVYEAMDGLANQTAPIARSWWKWLILIQAVGVAVPLSWLVRRTFHWAPSVPAVATLFSVLIFTATLWWWRWRRTQRTWARARLIAEVARSQLAAEVCPVSIERPSLKTIPALAALLERREPGMAENWPAWRDTWIRQRLEDQLHYFETAKTRAESQRKQLSLWITLSMDFMLALAVAGAILTLSRQAPQWLRIFGDVRLESALGCLGVILPVSIILFQSLRSLLELNRRTSRFSRQIAMLEYARGELQAAVAPEAAARIVQATESQLLNEVVDWYYESETAQQYFKLREGKGEEAEKAAQHRAKDSSRRKRIIWALGLGGIGLAFLGRVLLGRAPWVIGSSLFTLLWLAFNIPVDPEARSRLAIDGKLLDEHGEPWRLSPERSAYGCVVIVHGLHDGPTQHGPHEQSNWTIRMARAMSQKLPERTPNIGLVDWSGAAVPTDLLHIEPRVTVAKFLADVAAIRPQAREIGDALAFRLAQLILEKQIDTRRPLHFIGHSAGGFVVSRAALDLKKMNLAPATMRVTLLDTPGPDDEVLVELPAICPVDYYVTSSFVQGLRDDAPPNGIRVKHIAADRKLSLLESHSEGHEWYLRSIEPSAAGQDGFGFSPLLNSRPPAP